MASENTSLLPKGKDSRIGIIGGGPSGIAAAWFLMKKGYKNVVILEKSGRVGGKCETVTFTDSKGVSNNYELGAEYITYAYNTIYSFMDEVGEEWIDAGPLKAIMGKGEFANPTDLQPRSKTIPAMLRYLSLLIKYRKIIADPGNRGIAAYPDLSQSSGEFIKKHRLESLKGIFVVRQFGYGTFESFPAIHLLRTVPLPTLARIIAEEVPFLSYFFRRPIASLAKSGTQGLFEKMASRLDEQKREAYPGQPCVYLNQEVFQIHRESGTTTLTVKTSSDSYEFDKVIFGIPPGLVAGIMELPSDEKDLFMKMRYHSYWVGCLEFDRNMPKNYYQNLIMKDDEPVQFSKRWENSSVIAYGYNWLDAREAEDPTTQPKMEEVLKNYVKDSFLVESYAHMEKSRFWPLYHPHVPIEEFKAGYFDKIEALQGKYGVYFTGDGMAAESMEYSCKYSKQLIERFFT